MTKTNAIPRKVAAAASEPYVLVKFNVRKELLNLSFARRQFSNKAAAEVEARQYIKTGAHCIAFKAKDLARVESVVNDMAGKFDTDFTKYMKAAKRLKLKMTEQA